MENVFDFNNLLLCIKTISMSNKHLSGNLFSLYRISYMLGVYFSKYTNYTCLKVFVDPKISGSRDMITLWKIDDSI
jgi:hypothetical protein